MRNSCMSPIFFSSLKAAGAGDDGSSPPIVDIKREGAQLPPLAATNITAPSSRASSVTSETSQTDIRPSAGASKAERNQKNLMVSIQGHYMCNVLCVVSVL